MRPDPRQRVLTLLILLCLSLATLAAWKRNELPPRTALHPDSFAEPVQAPTRRTPFAVSYRGQQWRIIPRAEYALQGLVVSRNDIASVSDIYHDEDSFDTRDICVIWGDNLRLADYRHIDISSGAWTCYVRWAPGQFFDPKGLSNNHLITDNEAVRRQIAGLERGDQIRIRGLLVDYGPSDGRWQRHTSLARDDDGNGACEVLFVDALQVTRPGPVFWRHLFVASLWGAVLLLVGKAWRVLVFFREWG